MYVVFNKKQKLAEELQSVIKKTVITKRELTLIMMNVCSRRSPQLLNRIISLIYEIHVENQYENIR